LLQRLLSNTGDNSVITILGNSEKTHMTGLLHYIISQTGFQLFLTSATKKESAMPVSLHLIFPPKTQNTDDSNNSASSNGLLVYILRTEYLQT